MAISRPDTHLAPVIGCTSFDPADLMPVNDFKALDTERLRLGVHSMLVCVVRVTEHLASYLEQFFDDFPSLAEEIKGLLDANPQVVSVYTVTHFNTNDSPCGSLMVSVEGDCYRQDQVSFGDVLDHTALLAKAMARKSVMMFPDLPVMHGGKEGTSGSCFNGRG